MNRFTTEPQPVAQNGTVKVCYDFTNANSPVHVVVKWDGAGNVDFWLSKAEPCTFLAVPPTATGGLCIDESEQSEDHSITVTP